MAAAIEMKFQRLGGKFRKKLVKIAQDVRRDSAASVELSSLSRCNSEMGV